MLGKKIIHSRIKAAEQINFIQVEDSQVAKNFGAAEC
jgi:hypothetical protein